MGAPEPKLPGKYELLHALGRGGMAELYLARMAGVHGFAKIVAVKRILPHLAQDRLFVDMFLNESRVAARLAHQNVCSVYELHQEGDELFLVMEYLDGIGWDALRDHVPRDAWGLRLIASVLAQACEGLHYAHTFRELDGTQVSVVHRDVSPQNLFVTVDGVCKLLDFGVSKLSTDHSRTRTGVIKGKLPYMAPEQIRGEPVDGRADVWALGVVLWEAVTGQRLFDRATDFLIYTAISEEPVPSVGAYGAPEPAAIDRVIARALDRELARRATARELAGELTQLATTLGGALSHGELAAALQQLCGGPLAERKRAIAAAVTRARAAAPAAVAPLGPPDAAETLSIALRRDELVVARSGRRWRPLALGGAGLAVVALLGVYAATRTAGVEPARPVVDAPSSPPAAEPARQPAASPRPAPVLTAAPAVASPTPRAPLPRPAARPIKRAPAPRAPSTEPAPAPPAAGPPGTIDVDSEGFATIFVDGAARGVTPVRLTLPPGPHELRGVRADGRAQTRSVRIASGSNPGWKLTW